MTRAGSDPRQTDTSDKGCPTGRAPLKTPAPTPGRVPMTEHKTGHPYDPQRTQPPQPTEPPHPPRVPSRMPTRGGHQPSQKTGHPSSPPQNHAAGNKAPLDYNPRSIDTPRHVDPNSTEHRTD